MKTTFFIPGVNEAEADAVYAFLREEAKQYYGAITEKRYYSTTTTYEDRRVTNTVGEKNWRTGRTVLAIFKSMSGAYFLIRTEERIDRAFQKENDYLATAIEFDPA